MARWTDGLDVREIIWFAAFVEHQISIGSLFEDLEFRELMNSNRDLISRASQSYDSVEDLQRALNSQNQRFVKILENVSLLARSSILVLDLITATTTLLSPEWLKLVRLLENLIEFNKKLKQCLGGLKTMMKELYGVPSHRPPTKTSRDRDIWLLKKKDPSRSWGQIGHKFGLTDGAAELAFKR